LNDAIGATPVSPASSRRVKIAAEVPNALTHPIPLMTTPVRTGAYVTIAVHAAPSRATRTVSSP
jgi:hypothetical protein